MSRSKLSNSDSLRVCVAMSGGIDSAVTALHLARQGHKVSGIHMLLSPENSRESLRAARALAAAEDARKAAEKIGIPFEQVDLGKEFHQAVVLPFVQSYCSGHTPNPCPYCNRQMKLGFLLEKAIANGADALATGHYVRIARSEATGRTEILRGADPRRDQSYYLFLLTQAQLSRFLAPLGIYAKEDVRAVAREHGLTISEKRDSQDICFVPEGEYRDFLELHLAGQDLAGNFVDLQGNILGRHPGIHHYTVGQRRGIGISARHPLYVVDICAAERTIVLGKAEDLDRVGLEAIGANWVAIPGLAGPLRARVQIRYRHAASPALLLPGNDPDRVTVVFDAPQRAITRGQAAVFYDESNQRVLGGGWINRAN